jgi:hypothetical protein
MIGGMSTFRAKVFFPILFLVLAIVFSTGYLYVLRQGAVIESGLEKRGRALVEILAKGLRVGISTRSDEYIDEAMKNVLEVDDVLGARVFDSDDRVLRYISRTGNLQQNILSGFSSPRDSWIWWRLYIMSRVVLAGATSSSIL